MTTLTALCSDVYELTKRPDLVGETELAVRAATLKAHQSDYYPKDLYETAIRFESESYLQSLDYKQIVPQFRALKYLRKYDPSQGNNATGAFLTILSPAELLDSYGINREDVAYLAGSSLEIRSKDLLQYILLGCYVHPVVTSSGYSSWIAEEHPFFIVFEAARTLFKTIGFDEQAAMYDKLVQEQLILLRMSQITAEGY